MLLRLNSAISRRTRVGETGRWTLFLGLLIAVALVGCSKREAAVTLPPLVKTVVVQTTGAVASSAAAAQPVEQNRTLRAELAGTVLEVLVRPGDTVQAGQALARLDPRDAKLSDSAARIQAAAARAELASAEADFARYTELRDKSYISEAEFGRRQAALAVARAQYEATLDRLGVNTLRAGQRAKVSEVLVQAGQAVSVGSAMVVLQSSAEATAAAPRPSSTGSAGRLAIPTTALLDGRRVLVVQSAGSHGAYKVVSRAVRLGGVDERTATVLAGLSDGERIVAVGAHLLVEGQAVRLLETGQP